MVAVEIAIRVQKIAEYIDGKVSENPARYFSDLQGIADKLPFEAYLKVRPDLRRLSKIVHDDEALKEKGPRIVERIQNALYGMEAPSKGYDDFLERL